MNEDRLTGPAGTLPLYITGSHPCSYLPRLVARTLFLDPLTPLDGALYEALLAKGFRRSGAHVYRPACEPCRRCVPIRVPVDRFAPNRSQRRNLRLNADVISVERAADFDPEHFALYAAYVRSRHPGGSMTQDLSPESYRDFLIRPWGGDTLLLELRLDQRLIAVAVTDRLPGALSAVYTFFDPDLSQRAPGGCALLRQIALARSMGLRYLYLGYWIEECQKMSYKDAYRPLQAFTDGGWTEYARGEPIGHAGARKA